jgi:hypothetical protein
MFFVGADYYVVEFSVTVRTEVGYFLLPATSQAHHSRQFCERNIN